MRCLAGVEGVVEGLVDCAVFCLCKGKVFHDHYIIMFWAQCAHTQLNPFYHPFYPAHWAGPGNKANINQWNGL